ncbi:MAG: hypothetical protein HY055_09875 [Magnetospirillum sp.]|nr:hypothetical protein [Magnetospirillum sp.]
MISNADRDRVLAEDVSNGNLPTRFPDLAGLPAASGADVRVSIGPDMGR